MNAHRLHRRGAFGALLSGVLLMSACFDAQVFTREVAARDAGAGDAQVSDSGPADAAADSSEADGVRHPLCDMALTDAHLGAAFEANEELLEDSMFNAFAEQPCVPVEHLRCSAKLACPFDAFCISTVPGEDGYCVTQEGSELLGYQDGTCHRKITFADKESLCCLGVPGMDCRTLPFTTRGGPGLFCASTRDCEEGLVCRATRIDGADDALLGTCQCPEASSDLQGDPAVCGKPSRARWGEPATPLPQGTCGPSEDPAFVQEVIFGGQRIADLDASLRLIRAPSGEPAFVHPSGPLIAREADMPDGLPGTKQLDFAFGYAAYNLQVSSFDQYAAFDGQGELVVTCLLEDGTYGICASAGSAEWVRRALPRQCPVVRAFAVDPQGHTHVVCDDVDLLVHQVESGAGFTETTFPSNGFLLGELAFPDAGAALAVGIGPGSTNTVLDLTTGETLFEGGSEYIADVAYAGSVVALTLGEGPDDYQVDTWTRTGAGEFQHAPVWTLPDLLFNAMQDFAPTIAVRADGSIAVAHRTEEGIALTQWGNGWWETRVLTHEDGRPQVVLGAQGDIQVYYTVDADWNGQPDGLRRLREGTCAP